MMWLRLVAALMLAAQLTQLAAPVLCLPATRPAPCHETSGVRAPQLLAPAPAHQVPCGQTAMCAAPVLALPETGIALTTPVAGNLAAPAVRTLRPSDQPPPLSPPPQA